jgi:hypothetical protein
MTLDMEDGEIAQVNSRKSKSRRLNQRLQLHRRAQETDSNNVIYNNEQQKASIPSEQKESDQLQGSENKKEMSPFMRSVATGGVVLAVYWVGRGLYRWLMSRRERKKRMNSARRFNPAQDEYEAEARW